VTLPITVHEELLITRRFLDRARSRFRSTGRARAVVDGRSYPCRRGAWATWIPALGAKFLNSIDGRLRCLHRSAPPRREVLRPEHGEAGYCPWGVSVGSLTRLQRLSRPPSCQDELLPWRYAAEIA